MTEEQLNKVKDLFNEDGVDFTPEAIEDEGEMNFDKPIKGGYKARIVSLKRYQGESEKCETGKYDMYAMSLQIVELVDGQEAVNRYVSKTYSNTESTFKDKVTPASDGKRRLMNDLFTGGVKYDIVREANTTAEQVVEQIAPQIVDQVVSIRCFPGRNVDKKTGEKKQIVKIVKEIKVKATSEDSTDSNSW